MIRPRLFSITLCAVAASVLTACDKAGNPPDLSTLDNWMPGKPKAEDRWKPGTAITDPATIYKQNCLGCHSLGATTSPAIALNNPAYLAVIPPDTLKGIITNGVPGSQMPAFSTEKGGSLSKDQIDILAAYIFANKKPIEGPLPAYSAPLGNPAAGQALYETYVASLKKTVSPAVFRDGFMTNPAFLGLVSDQYLRTLLIAGQPEIGVPDFRTAIAGRPLSEQDISDLTAWLVSNRKNEFGQPLTTPTP